jgi:glycosidase
VLVLVAMTRACLLVFVLAACPASQSPGLGDDDGGPCEGEDCPASCDTPRAVGDLAFCAETAADGYTVIVRYTGSSALALGEGQVTLNGEPFDAAGAYDSATQTFTIRATDVAPSKYSFLFRMRTEAGADLRPLFIPMWIGADTRYADFTWQDSVIYQIFTDRFLDGDPTNNIDNSVGDLARVDDPRSRWQGGDFAGITAKIRDGYFEAMGVNTLWISSPILDSHSSQPSVQLSDNRRFASYHSYHPVATGYTHLDNLGYTTAIEPAFGTEEELHTLVNEAHQRGIRIIPDFVTNHIHREGKLYQQHPEWFFGYNACDNRWDEARIGCWFTTDTPDFDYGSHPDAIARVVDHALWMIQEFNFDGFRADALKHMDDKFIRALKAAIVAEVETTVENHALSVEPTVFYMVGESLGGWARYHVRVDMVQGQVDEEYYNKTKAALLTFNISVRSLADFAIYNDTAYLTPQDTFGGRGGYPGAVMGNFFGNHDQVRALTEAGGQHARLRLAQTFLMTSPGNIPMVYQGDDIGTEGGADPDNRKMHRFSGLSTAEQQSLANIQKAGTLRMQHPAMRRGVRSHVVVEDWYWVFKLTYADDEVYVAINRDNNKQWSPPPGFVDGLGNCSNGVVPILSTCIFVRQ